MEESNEHALNEKCKLYMDNSSDDWKLDPYECVNNLFAKRFQITDNDNYLLPQSETMFKDNLWEINELQVLKNELNSVKNCLNNYSLNEWHMHTKLTKSTKDLLIRLKTDIKVEFVTQAWCKFYEIASSFPLVPVDHIVNNNNRQFKSVHLCEAPGAFVVSLNHWLKSNAPDINWDWIATTLNPYYEGNPRSIMIDDDRFIKNTLSHWCFGEDNTGNIMNLSNLDKLIKQSGARDDILLITADGSINCIDVPAEQENVVAHLHFCETVAALHLLSTGGSFLLKVFTIFECQSVCLIYLLACCFDKINITKPATSKGGNSETYVVCTHFKGTSFISQYLEEFRKHYECGSKQAMFSKDSIPPVFIEKMIKYSEFVNTWQCLAIRNNIITFKSDNVDILKNNKKIQCMVADKYIKDYNLRKLTSGEIVGRSILNNNTSLNLSKNIVHSSYTERCEKQHSSPWNHLRELFNDSKKIKIYASSKKVIKFQKYKLPNNLQISFGKSFCKVNSSRFCKADILEIQNDVTDILTSMGVEVQFPSTKNINKLSETILMETGHKILTFQYTDTYDSHEIITKIYDVFQVLDFSENLIIIGYSLLTQLNVGLLYIISGAFNSMKVQLCNDVGSKIIFTHYNYSIKILKHLLDIQVVSHAAQEKGKTILQIVPLSFLHDCELFFKIVDINHWVVKSYVHCVASALEENTLSMGSNT